MELDGLVAFFELEFVRPQIWYGKRVKVEYSNGNIYEGYVTRDCNNGFVMVKFDDFDGF